MLTTFSMPDKWIKICNKPNFSEVGKYVSNPVAQRWKWHGIFSLSLLMGSAPMKQPGACPTWRWALGWERIPLILTFVFFFQTGNWTSHFSMCQHSPISCQYVILPAPSNYTLCETYKSPLLLCLPGRDLVFFCKVHSPAIKAFFFFSCSCCFTTLRKTYQLYF